MCNLFSPTCILYPSAIFFLLALSENIKSHWLQISRIAGQVQKIENPETLPQERFLVALFENVIPIFQEINAFQKFAKNENALFYLIKYAKHIGKIDEVLGNRIETIYNFRTRDQLSIRASPFVYLTIGSFNFFKYYKGLRRLSKICLFKLQWKL